MIYMLADFGKEKDNPRWREIVAATKASDKGGAAGKWSAVKASIAVRKYKDNGGKYKTKERGALGNANWFQQQKANKK